MLEKDGQKVIRKKWYSKTRSQKVIPKKDSKKSDFSSNILESAKPQEEEEPPPADEDAPAKPVRRQHIAQTPDMCLMIDCGEEMAKTRFKEIHGEEAEAA